MPVFNAVSHFEPLRPHSKLNILTRSLRATEKAEALSGANGEAIPHSEIRTPELSEIASVSSFSRNEPTFSVCVGASSPGAQSRIFPPPTLGERARVRAGGMRCGVSHVSVPADRTPASAVPTCSDK